MGRRARRTHLECGRSGTYETMPTVRLTVLLLIVALTGPSIGSLLCDWTCAAKHQRTEAGGACHQHLAQESTSTVAAAHPCHGLTSAPLSILTDARQAGLSAPVVVAAPLVIAVESADRVTHRSHDLSYAPPPLTLAALRI